MNIDPTTPGSPTTNRLTDCLTLPNQDRERERETRRVRNAIAGVVGDIQTVRRRKKYFQIRGVHGQNPPDHSLDRVI